jgi:hypothetical protein
MKIVKPDDIVYMEYKPYSKNQLLEVIERYYTDSSTNVIIEVMKSITIY